MAKWWSAASRTFSVVVACAARGCAGRENLHKRYLVHVAGFNLSVLMRTLFGCGTPREAAGLSQTFLFVVRTETVLPIAVAVGVEGETAALALGISVDVG